MDLKETLGEELYTQVTEKLGDKKILVNDGSYIPKSRLDEVISQKKTYEDQLNEFNNKLKQFEPLESENEKLKSLTGELKTQMSKIKEEADKNLESTKFNSLLDLALIKANVRNPKAVKALLDMSEIKRDGDQLLHLEKQLEAVKESDPYLFNDKEKPNVDTGKKVLKSGDKKEEKAADFYAWKRQNPSW